MVKHFKVSVVYCDTELTANNFKTSFKKIEPRVEEMIQKLSTFSAFVKVPGLIPSYHMAA